MCDEHSLNDMVESVRRARALSRRQFGALALGAGLVASLPRAAGAAELSEKMIEIKTPDGTADAFYVHPAKGSAPGVLMWPDIGGLRPAFQQMGRRLAEAGYAVLVPNPFYRSRKSVVAPNADNVLDDAARQAMRDAARQLNPATHVTDAKAFIPWLDAQPEVDRKRRLGTTGYCMGGPIAMRTAANFPGRVGAGATFHGAALASATNADSPHLLVPQMKASFLCAIAANDDERDPEQKNLLRAAFDAAKLAAEIEVYAGTKHGWCPPDGAVYDMAAAEKAWARQLELLRKALA